MQTINAAQTWDAQQVLKNAKDVEINVVELDNP